MTSQRTLSLVQTRAAAPPPSLKEQLCTSIRSSIQNFIDELPPGTTGTTRPTIFSSERPIYDTAMIQLLRADRVLIFLKHHLGRHLGDVAKVNGMFALNADSNAQAGRVFLLEAFTNGKPMPLLPISATEEDLGDFCDRLHRHTQKHHQNGYRALAIALIPQASGNVRLRASVFGNSSSDVASSSNVTVEIHHPDFIEVKLGHFLNDILKVFDPSHPRFQRDAKFSLLATRRSAP